MKVFRIILLMPIAFPLIFIGWLGKLIFPQAVYLCMVGFAILGIGNIQ